MGGHRAAFLPCLPCGCMCHSPPLYDCCLVFVLIFCALFHGSYHKSVGCIFGAFRAHSSGLAWNVELLNSMHVLLDLLMFFCHAAQFQIPLGAVLPIGHASFFAGSPPQTCKCQL